MTEHVQLEIIAAVIIVAGQIITAWRANTAAVQAKDANMVAVKAQEVATETRAVHTAAIEQVHLAVNGTMEAAQREIAQLRAEVIRLNAIIAERVQ